MTPRRRTPPPGLTVAQARALRAAGEWQSLVDRAATLPEEELMADAELAFLYAVGCRRTGSPLRALEVLERVEPAVRRRGDRPLLAETVNLVGICLWESGRVGEAEDRFAELLDSATAWQDEVSIARACNNLGVLANVRGRRDLALTYYQRALAAFQRLGDVRGLSETHHNLGISYRDLGFDRDADEHFARAVALAEGENLQDVIALAETERAMMRARWGDGPLAERMGRRARARFERISDPTGVGQALRVLAAAASVQQRRDEAAAQLEEALRIASAHTDALLHAEVQRDRGLLLRDAGRRDEARDAYHDALQQFDRIGAVAEAEAVRAILGDLNTRGAAEG